MSTAYHSETDGQTERVNQQIECFLRCFISAHPTKWSKWLPLYEFWYNTNWHSALNKTPFEIIYGQTPRFFGISASDTIAPVDVQSWLDSRQLMIASVKQHLLPVQQRMKHQADKKRTERVFAANDLVFLKLQPYVQSSVVRRANHKLSFKYFGPYKILDKIGEVAYRLELPPGSRIHPVFHVSQLKKFIPPTTWVQTQLPSPSASLQVHVQVLDRRVRQSGRKTVMQGLILWSCGTPATATWEDLDSLKQEFPRAPAWGQAGSQGEGDVSIAKTRTEPLVQSRRVIANQQTVADPATEDGAIEFNQGDGPAQRPKRATNPPRWLDDYSLAR